MTEEVMEQVRKGLKTAIKKAGRVKPYPGTPDVFKCFYDEDILLKQILSIPEIQKGLALYLDSLTEKKPIHSKPLPKFNKDKRYGEHLKQERLDRPDREKIARRLADFKGLDWEWKSTRLDCGREADWYVALIEEAKKQERERVIEIINRPYGDDSHIVTNSLFLFRKHILNRIGKP